MPDTFISYAHLDNNPIPGKEDGWVSHLANQLKVEVKRQRRPCLYDLWRDQRMRGNDSITPEIEQQVRDSKTLLIILSNSWINSSWCKKELEIFCKTHKKLEKRIFVVEISDIKKKPKRLRDLLGYRFWHRTNQNRPRQLGCYSTTHKTDNIYTDQMSDLSYDIASNLQKIDEVKTTETTETTETTVYVAPSCHNLNGERRQLINELKQFKIEILPRNNNEDEDFDKNLEQCSHFIQLLNTNSLLGIPQKQLTKAQKSTKHIMQWHDYNLDYSNVDRDQEALLEGTKINTEPFTDFIRLVRDTVLPEQTNEKNEVARQDNTDMMIYIHACPEDITSAQKLATELAKKDFGVTFPDYNLGKKVRKSIERGYQQSNFILVLQKNSPNSLVADLLADAHQQTKGLNPTPPILVCRSDIREILTFTPPRARTLSCNNNFNKDCLEKFLHRMDSMGVKNEQS